MISIDTGYACFGLIVENGVVIKAPPIARWTVGKKVDYVIDYYTKKKTAKVYVHERTMDNRAKAS